MLAYLENPIVLRELRSRMRGGRAVWLQLLYVGVLSFVVVAAWLAARHGDAAALLSGRLGRQLFDCLSVAQGTLLALTAPAFAAGAFTLEREQQTLETLLVSPLSTGRMVRGKLTAATLFLVLLLTISVPMLALTFLFGGVSPDEVLGTYAVQLANGLFLGAVGLAWSLTCNGTAAATMATYLTVVAYLIPASILAEGAGEGFLLAAMSPVTACFAAGQKVALLGHEVALWAPGTLAVLFLAAWVVDVAICRARRFRNAQRCSRPRWWMLAFTGLACTVGLLSAVDVASFTIAPVSTPAGVVAPDLLEAVQVVCYFLLFVGSLVALTFATDDVDSADHRPGAWWAFWRGEADGAPLYMVLLPLLVWPVAVFVGHRAKLAGFEWMYEAALATGVTAATLVLVASGARMLNELIGRRWPAVALGICVLSALTALDLVVEGLVGSGDGGGWLIALWAMSPLSNLGALHSSTPQPLPVDQVWQMSLLIGLLCLAGSLLCESIGDCARRRAGRVRPAAPTIA
ncbi:MAG: ABC transporter permease [Armatimonadetes bacterium]|nr:ABC transporter permease [Armatimonadota bacterium]